MPPKRASVRERSGALRNLPPFPAMVWRTSPVLTLATLLLRLARALPIATLFIGKLIIDEVVRLVALPGKPVSLADWWSAGLLARLGLLLAAEFGLAVLSDILGRVVSLVDSLVSERVSNDASVRLMEHAASSTWRISRTPTSRTSSIAHAGRRAAG
jgi:ATP-binding cassette subfamily B protein